jgi:hypothetical protein
MTTVIGITPVVNLDVDYACRQHRLVTPIEALLLRIDEVLRAKTFSSERDWCRKAGVSESYIAAMRLRGGKDGTGEVHDVKREQVVRLAKAAGLDPAYLMGSDIQTMPAPATAPVEKALEAFPWRDHPMTPDQAESMMARVRQDATAHPSLPVAYWSAALERIAAEIVATKSRVRATVAPR